MRTIAAILLVTSLSSIPFLADARTWYITPDGTGDAPTIQAGIDSAQAGDTVLLACGTYYEFNINLKFGVSVCSETRDPSCVTIDAQQQERVLFFRYSTSVDSISVIEGLTITGGLPGGAHPNSPIGGGIFLSRGASFTIRKCNIQGNTVHGPDSIGGGLYCSRSSPRLIDCSFIGNSAVDIGGGAYFQDSGYPVLIDCVFSDNSAEHGGGVHAHAGVSPHFVGCTFYGNMADKGGAMHIQADALTVEGCLFYDNSAIDGAGIYSYHTPSIITNSTVVANSGAGMSLFYDPMAISNTIVCFNTGIGGEGVRYFCTTPVFSCCDIYGNSSGDWTGDIEDQLGINGNISEDPLFCGEADYPGDPYRLDIASPCAVRNSPCGALIGARPAGCSEGVSVERTTWGRIKATYR